MSTTLPPVIGTMMDALARFDAQGYQDCFADPFVCEEPVTGRTVDRDELPSHVTVSAENWESYSVEITDAIVDGPTIAIAYTCHMRGKANGFEGVDLALECNALLDIAPDGRIARWHEQYDTDALRRARRS